MSEGAIIAAMALAFYPAIVLLVAITGPHSKYERHDRHD